MATTTLQFVRSSYLQLYVATCSGQSVTAGPQVAFLLPQDGTADTPLTLQETWSQAGGVYIFLDTPIPPGSEQVFAQAVWNFLGAYPGARIAWFSNPADAARGLQGYVVSTYTPGTTTLTQSLTTFFFQSTSFLLGPNCTVQIDPANNWFTFSQPTGTNRSIYFQTGSGAEALYIMGATVILPLCGAQSGCLNGSATLGTSDLDNLDVGLRMFYPDTANSGSDGFFLLSQRYPIFNPDLHSIAIYPCLDPLAPMVGARTCLSFTSLVGSSAAAAPIDSYFRTNLGYVVQLTPQGNARLVFASRPAAGAPSPADPSYLVPQGDFSIVVVRNTGASAEKAGDSLMCGLSGVEYVKLASDQTDPINLISFFPGHGAFAPDFIPGQPPATAAGQGLPDPPPAPVSATTSWAYVQAPTVSGGLTYCAQPDDATLHSPDAPGGQSNPCPPALFFKEIDAAQLEAANTYSNPPAFPLMPYAGPLDGSVGAEVYKQFELQVLSPVRRRNIPGTDGDGRASQPAASTPCDSTPSPSDHLYPTPQGLMGIFSDDSSPIWKQLILASDATTPVPQQIAFTCLTQGTAVRSAVQTNQMFLVISNQGTLPDPTQLSDHYAGSNLTIQQWNFDLSLSNWSQHQTILILKFYGKSLHDLAADISTWTMPGAFNGDPADVSQQLLSILQDAQTTYDNGDPETQEVYDHFVNQVMKDPSWSGVLALRVNCPTNDLPADLAGLAAGIDTNKFYAHHLGVEVTPIDLSNNQLSIKPSSLFGLIDYANPQYPPPNATGYNFKVDTLRVLFSNSQIVSFSSQIELTMDMLFGEATSLQNSPSGRNNVILNGRYDTHGSRPAYTYTFSGDNIFSMPGSNVLNTVEITQAQFVTNTPAGGFNSDSQVRSRFSLWGRLNFQQIQGFDLFSFGSQSGGEGSGQYLSFSNLGITMSFAQGSTNPPTFAFDPGEIAFDPQRSTPRPQSLYAHFPMTIAGLAFSSGDQATADLGYMPVQSPLVSSGLGTEWYGLIYNLDLGSAGALASDAGLTVNLMTAWSPQPGGLSAFLGLKFPGSGSTKQFSLQGVLKVVFGDIRLVVTGTANTSVGYLLQIRNIALKLLALTFPPNGQTEIIIFGNPGGSPSNRTLGWYAAYAENPPQQPKSPSLPAVP